MYKVVLNGDGTPYTKNDIFWFIALPIFFITLGFISINGYNYMHDKKRYDGTIKHRFEEKLENTKTNEVYDIKKYFIVKFDSIPDVVEINVDSDSYFSYKEGSRVSFKMSKSKLNLVSGWIKGVFIISSLLLIVNAFFLLMYIVNGIYHFRTHYKLVWVSIKKIRIRKSVDPYGEETWDD